MVDSEQLAVGVLKATVHLFLDLQVNRIITSTHVPDRLQDTMFAHQTMLHIADINRQIALEIVEDADLPLFWTVLVALLVWLDVYERRGTRRDLVTQLIWCIARLWNLDDLVNQWVRSHIDHADLPVRLPGHEAGLLQDRSCLLGVVTEERGRYGEEDFA